MFNGGTDVCSVAAPVCNGPPQPRYQGDARVVWAALLTLWKRGKILLRTATEQPGGNENG